MNVNTLPPATLRCPKCGADISIDAARRAVAAENGRLGGRAGKGSPARRRAAQANARARWAKR